MLPPVFPILAAASAVTTLIGTNPTRAFPHAQAPQKRPEGEYVTWSFAGYPENTLDEVPRVDRHEVQVDCWGAKGADSVDVLAKAVRNALEPYAYMTALIADQFDEETQRPRMAMQFTFWTDRT